MDEPLNQSASEGFGSFAVPKAPAAIQPAGNPSSPQQRQHFYTPPEWSAPPPSSPSQQYALEIIKDGKVLEQIPLRDSDHFLLGRQSDLVHIPMDHSSLSRVHAVINFHRDGSVMLMDMNSAHGTFVNKNRLEAAKFVKLQVNDVIKFGASTRLYILLGPVNEEAEGAKEVESEELRLLRLRAEKRTQRREQEKEAERNAGISWGMDDDIDDDNYYKGHSNGNDEASAKSKRNQSGERKEEEEEKEEEDDERFRRGDRSHSRHLPEYLRRDENYDRKYGDKFMADIREDEIHNDKDRDLLEKIRKRERKIQNMQEEIRRIYLKENSQEDGLTEGQLAAVAKNDKAIVQLSSELDDMIRRIRTKNTEREANAIKAASDSSPSATDTKKKKKRPAEDMDNGDDEDDEDEDVYDISDATADVNTNWRMRKKMIKLSTAAGFIHSTSTSVSASSSMSLGYVEIKQECDLNEERLIKVSSVFASVQDQLQRDEGLLRRGNEDEVGVLIIGDRMKEARQKLHRLVIEQDEIKLRASQLQKLLHAATPALKSLVIPSHRQQQQQQEKDQERIVRKEEQGEGAVTEMDVEEPIDSGHNNNNSKAIKLATERAVDNPEADYEQQRQVAFEDFQRFVEEEAVQSHDLVAEEEIVAKPSSTPKMHQQTVNKPKKAMKPAAPQPMGPQRPADMAEVETYAALQRGLLTNSQVLQSGEMVWIPPKQQRGDGKTALNDKYGY